MEIFKKEPNIDFLRIKWVCITISLLLILGGIVSAISKHGYRYGIDFTGGTQLIVGFRDPMKSDELREKMQSVVEEAGVVIQRFEGTDTKNYEFLIRIQEAKEGSDITTQILDGLAGTFNENAGGKFDLNRQGAQDLKELLEKDGVDASGVGDEDPGKHYQKLADTVIAERSQKVIFKSVDEAAAIEGLPADVSQWIKANTVAGPFTVLAQDNVGPQVGKQLRERGILAVFMSILGMLIYIAIRFDFKFGVGAIVALTHDVLVTLGFFSFFDREITLVVVAAFLTLVGYSVNDTVVVYDRIRENKTLMKRAPIHEIVNKSLNQMLARTLVLSGTTLLTVAALYFFGGDVIHDFAFALLVGIIVGTYSSIYIAAPIVIGWNEMLDKRRSKAAEARA